MNSIKMTKRLILSISGGGIRGVIVARFLENLEREIKKPIYEVFDLYVGTSVGAMLCGCYVNGQHTAHKTSNEIMSLENCQKIMSGDMYNFIFGRIMGILPRYSGIEKRRLIKEHIDIDIPIRRAMYISYDVENNEPMFFKSWDDKQKG